MSKTVSEHHPLRRLFATLTEQAFVRKLRWPDLNVISYLTNLLTDFTHVDQLCRIRDGQGKRIDEIAGMLLESDLLLNAGSLEREREVNRHIGDFALFMVGIFPEFLRRIKLNQIVHHPDFLIDYVRVGKHSYRNVSEFNYGEHRNSVPLFRKLSDNFELCVMGLGYVKNHLEQLPNTHYREAKNLLLS